MKHSLFLYKIFLSILFSITVLSFTGIFCVVTAGTTDYPEVIFILDASGSMWGKAGDKTKIEAAKAVMVEVVPALAPEVKVGLVVYGHRRKGDCKDIEVLIHAGSDDRTGLVQKVKTLQPKGKTPITDAISTVVEQLKTKENETSVVLISDGIETCAADPCKLIKELKDTGIKFVLHVVGFGVTDDETRQLNCLADAGGGKYLAARDGNALLEALNNLSSEIGKKVEVEKAKSLQVKVKTGLGKIRLSMPDSTTRGMEGLKIFRVSDGKLVKETERLAAETTHPLMAGEYELDYLFATPNYGDATVTKLGKVSVTSGETREIRLGGIAFNIAKTLEQKTPVEHVIIAESGSGNPIVVVHNNNNGYYNFKPKAILPGKYNIFFHYSNSPEPTMIANDIIVKPGEETVVTLDSGIIFKEVTETSISGWDLIPLVNRGKTADTIEDDELSTATTPPLLQARPPSGNKSTLWKPFIVPPGIYRLMVNVDGMDEPLTVAEELVIRNNQTLDFDSGL
ncbi:MAG: VWA domain-containing protein [Desulfamplus sp.]|nr:VWA domain-containing protein [Desulfamplus sp.]